MGLDAIEGSYSIRAAGDLGLQTARIPNLGPALALLAARGAKVGQEAR